MCASTVKYAGFKIILFALTRIVLCFCGRAHYDLILHRVERFMLRDGKPFGPWKHVVFAAFVDFCAPTLPVVCTLDCVFL